MQSPPKKELKLLPYKSFSKLSLFFARVCSVFFMLKKNQRLKNNRAFTATFKNGHVLSGKFVKIFCGKEKTKDIPTKAGFVVSKKIHKRAVVRNKIKRRLREIFSVYLKSRDITCMSLIFLAKQECVDANFDELKKSVFENLNDLYPNLT